MRREEGRNHVVPMELHNSDDTKSLSVPGVNYDIPPLPLSVPPVVVSVPGSLPASSVVPSV